MFKYIILSLYLLVNVVSAQPIECPIDNDSTQIINRGLPPPPIYTCNQIIQYRVVFECDYQYYVLKGNAGCINACQQAFNYMRPIYLRDLGIDLVNAGIVINTTDNDGYTMPPTTSGILNEIVAKWNNTPLYNQYRPMTVALISGRITNTSLGGFAYPSSYCGPGPCVANGLATVNDQITLNKVIAHEIAHTLGARHDSSCSPAYLGYLMGTTVSSGSLDRFSPCTINDITASRRRGWPCLTNYSCCADLDGSGSVGIGDLFVFLNGYFSDSGDYNNDGATSVQDIFDFLNCYFR